MKSLAVIPLSEIITFCSDCYYLASFFFSLFVPIVWGCFLIDEMVELFAFGIGNALLVGLIQQYYFDVSES